MSIRPLALLDLPYVYGFRDEAIGLDTARTLTRGNPLGAVGLFAYVNPARHIYSAIANGESESVLGRREIGVMRAGDLEQWDAPWRLYHSPATRFVADFVGEGCFIQGTVLGPGRVSTELGVIEGQLTLNQPAGAMVDLLLRPDDVIHDDTSALRAEVIERVFRGAQFQYKLRLPSGTTALSFAPSHHDHAIGERIGIRLDAQYLVGFPRG